VSGYSKEEYRKGLAEEEEKTLVQKFKILKD